MTLPINVNQNKREAFKVSLATLQSTDCEALQGIQLKVVSIAGNSDERILNIPLPAAIVQYELAIVMRLTACQALQRVPDFENTKL